MLENRLSVFSLSAGTLHGTSGLVIVRDVEALSWRAVILDRNTVLWVDLNLELNEGQRIWSSIWSLIQSFNANIQDHFVSVAFYLNSLSQIHVCSRSVW